MTIQNGGKVIPFAQSPSFYMKRGAKEMERNDLIRALTRYRQAYLSAPDQAEPCLAVAEILSQMQRFEESNRLLLLLLASGNGTPECFFGLACNYFGMREYDYAAESLENYLDADPDGAFALDAEDFLDMIDDDDAMYDMTGLRTDADFDDSASCVFARHLLDAGDYADAINELKRQVAVSPQNLQVQNLLAIAYFCTGDRAQAFGVTNAVLTNDPNNVAARCNLALLCHEAGDQAEALAHLRIAETHCGDLQEDLQALSVLELELEQYDRAEKTIRRLQQLQPFDTDTLHRLGYCRYMQNDFDEAESCYKQLLKINPDDLVARYYLAQSRKTEIAYKQRRARWLIAYEVPFSEAFRRLNQLNHTLGTPSDELLATWRGDRHFRNLLQWALMLPDRRVKRSMLSLLYTFGDEPAERMLREFLLYTNQPDDMKRVVFGMLKHLDAKEPYMAYLNGRWIQGRVNMLTLPYQLPAAYETVVQMLLQYMVGARDEACVTAAAHIYQAYIESLDRSFPRMSQMQEVSFAAALEYLGCKACGVEVGMEEIVNAYRISNTRLRNALVKLEPFAEAGVPQPEEET